MRQAIDITKKENAAIRAKLAKHENVPISKVNEPDKTEKEDNVIQSNDNEVHVLKVEPEAEPIQLIQPSSGEIGKIGEQQTITEATQVKNAE